VVARTSHKKIVIGRGGQLLKRIGAQARGEIERERGVRVYLDLWVKVVPDWRGRPDLLRALYPD
jgi:GTP-binding protein Era